MAEGRTTSDTALSDTALVHRRPALSPSRASDFKLCPLLYRFRAVDRLPERPGRAQVRGTLVHAVLERLYDLPPPERRPERARALVAPEWARLLVEGPELVDGLFSNPDDTELSAWLASAEPLLDAYFRLEDPRTLDPAARELLVETELASGLVLRGYVDRLDVAATGEVRIVDYKTGASPPPAAELRPLFQMKFYALLLLHLRGRVPTQLRLLYLSDGTSLTYVPDEVALRRFEGVLEAMWAAILAAGATGEFPPNPGRACEWCPHRARCPAWGGVAPPYPGWPVDVAEETPTDRAD